MEDSYYGELRISERETMYNNYLAHHGIKGQRWGVRRYQNEDGSLTAEGRARKFDHKLNYKSYYGHKVASTIANYGLAMIPGSSLMMTAIMTKTIYDTKFDRSDYLLNTKKTDGEIEKIKDMKKFNHDTSISEITDVKSVNPQHGKRGSVNNCTNCAIAIDMRSRGYDVQARKRGYGRAESEIAALYKNGSFKHPNFGVKYDKSLYRYSNQLIKASYENFCNAIESEGANTRGIVSISYREGTSGHAFNYEVKNGKVTFYDGQVKHNVDYTFINANPASLSYMRTDNLQPADNIGEAVISRKDNK